MPNARFTRITVTAVMGLIAALAFAFSFGNVWTLARQLGIPHPIAPLIAPMVDLSVVGLLVALRHLSLLGVDHAELRPATRLMHLSGLLTLALNTAEPLLLHHWGRAALDTVAPLLLLGWGTVGPTLLRHLHIPLTPLAPMPSREAASEPETAAPPPARTVEAAPAAAHPSPTSPAAQPEPPAAPRPLAPAVPDALLNTARQVARQHHDQHGQPITADQLRARLGLPHTLADQIHRELTPA